MHTFEVMAEAGPTASSRAVVLCDWMATVSLPDAGSQAPIALKPMSCTRARPIEVGVHLA